MSELKLSSAERTHILAGDNRALYRKDKPGLEKGHVHTVALTRARKWADEETGHVFAPDKEPEVWITVTDVVRRNKGGWSIYYEITDRRQSDFFMAPGGGYTTSRRSSPDHLSVVLSKKEQAKVTAEARQAAADQRAKDKEKAEQERRRQERAMRDRVRQTMQGLSPLAQQLLLAEIDRACQRALEVESEAA